MPPRRRGSGASGQEGGSPSESKRTTRSSQRNSQGEQNSPSVAPLPSGQQGSQGVDQMDVDNGAGSQQQQEQQQGTPGTRGTARSGSARGTPDASNASKRGRGGRGSGSPARGKGRSEQSVTGGDSPARRGGGTPSRRSGGGRGSAGGGAGDPPGGGSSMGNGGGGGASGSVGGAPPPSQQGRTPATPSTAQRERLGRADLGGRQPHSVPLRPLPPDLVSDSVAPVEGPDAGLDNTYIWGTTISVAATETAARRFLEGFVPEDAMEDETRSKYAKLIMQAVEEQDYVVNLDTADLRAWDAMNNSHLYKDMVMYPREVMPIFDSVAKNMAAEGMGTQEEVPDIQIKVYNLDRARTIRDLNPEDIDTLVSVQGMVTRTSSILPDLRAAMFKCERCGMGHEALHEGGRVAEPEQCSGCGAKWSCSLIHNMSTFTNKQMVKMQEKPNDIPEGETPHNVTMYVYEGNVDLCRPGDRVTITGTYRAQPMRVNPRQRALHAVFRTYLDVMHVQRDEQGRLFTLAAAQQEAAAGDDSQKQQQGGASQGDHGVSSAPPTGSQGPSEARETQDPFLADDDQNQFVRLGATTNEQVRAREAELRAIAADPRLYERLVASFAPNIWEMEDVKKGLLTQLFGGMGKAFPGGRVRGEINVLLVGDPSVSKSQLLSYVHALSPRGIYTSGKGSSAVGLTAYVSKDPETKELVLESGALVLSDRGVCCIDEFDKMSDGARSMLHEAMEQQTVSVAKAGLISTLNARTSVCACANPVGSRYNPNLTVAENIHLPPTLLTRFDLIYLLLDKFDEEKDLRLAHHLISLYHPGATTAARPQGSVEPLDMDTLRDYIAYARARVKPRMNDAAAGKLASVYMEMRRDGKSRKVVVATPRQLESLIRLAEAQARMYLSDVVRVEHVEEATRLWYVAMKGAATDESGDIDLEALHTGQSARSRQAARDLPDTLQQMLSAHPGRRISLSDLMESLGPMGITREQLVAALKTSLQPYVSFNERLGMVESRGGGGPSSGPEAME